MDSISSNSSLDTACASACPNQKSKPMASFKTRIRTKIHSFSSSRLTEKTDDIHQQSESPLFKLPIEIREKIWALVLTPTEEHKAPHFHVYDTVYDSCTYSGHAYRNKHHRENPRQVSLLLACRATKNEALHFLYDDTDFTLVLFAGRARPRDSSSAKPEDNLSERNCLGLIESCTRLFARMRKVTLIIQPGRRPNTVKYVARIARLLEAMNYCQNVKDLCLHFNFRCTFVSDEGGEDRFHSILQAFYPLKIRQGPLVIQTCAFWASATPDELFKSLHEAIPGSKVLPWCNIAKSTPCLVRGIIGQKRGYVDRSAMTKKERALDSTAMGITGAAYLLLFPLTLPLTYIGYRKWKLDKGEW